MTNTYKKPEPAVIRDLTGPEPQLNRAALRLLTGCDTPDDLAYDAANMPGSVQAAGIRRRQQYEAATGDTAPAMLDVLAYWARRDGVPLYAEDTNGNRTDLTMHGVTDSMPDLVVVTGDDGQPSGVVDEFGILRFETGKLSAGRGAPTLDACDAAGIDLRTGLADAADNARRTLPLD